MERPIHIAVAVDNAYVQHLAAMLSSLFANTAAGERIRVHVVGSGLDADQLDKINALIASHGGTMESYEFDLSILKDCPTHGHIELATYFRLMLHKVLPEDVKRCLYLDCDLIVIGDVADLWELGLGANEWIGGVQDAQPTRELSVLGMPDDSEYINAGVLLINLEQWRKEAIEHRFLTFIAEKREHLQWWDQDVLNACCLGQKKLIARDWNLTRAHAFKAYLPLLFRRSSAMPKIVHYTSAYKPWKRNDPHPLRGLYWKYLKKTPWADYRMPAITWKERWDTLYLRMALIYFNLKRMLFRADRKNSLDSNGE